MSRPASELAAAPQLLAWTIGLLLLAFPGCGRKAGPRPPHLVQPERIMDLRARPIRDGIRLFWSRPTQTVDGRTMPDLDGVRIARALQVPGVEPKELPFEHIATVLLDDRGRFDKIREMTYDDRTVVPGTTYFYQVEAFTLDGYHGRPSPLARASWRGPRRATKSP